MYKCIVADPPWTPTMSIINSPSEKIGASKGSPQRHYNTLTLEEICRMVPPSDKKSHLWLWCLSPHIDWGFEVCRSWGFEPLQTITWAKPGLGVGRFQCNTEHVILSRKGSRHGNSFGMTRGTWFNWNRGRHSEKPEEFFQLVEKCSPGPYLEMFSRNKREGWHTFGNEVESDIEIVY